MSQQFGKVTVTLPGRDEMLARLLEVDGTFNARTHLHPLLVENLAGKSLTTKLVVGWLSTLLLQAANRCDFDLHVVENDSYDLLLKAIIANDAAYDDAYWCWRSMWADQPE